MGAMEIVEWRKATARHPELDSGSRSLATDGRSGRKKGCEAEGG